MATTKEKHCRSRFSRRSISWTRRPSLQAPLMARHLWLRGDRRGGVVPPTASNTRDSLGFRGFEPGTAPLGSLESDSRSAGFTRRRRAWRGPRHGRPVWKFSLGPLRGFSSPPAEMGRGLCLDKCHRGLHAPSFLRDHWKGLSARFHERTPPSHSPRGPVQVPAGAPVQAPFAGVFRCSRA